MADQKISGEDMEQAERRLRFEYQSGGGTPREAHDRLVHHAHVDDGAIDTYVAQHVDLVQNALKRCGGEHEARRVLATMIMHHFAVGSTARAIAIANKRGGVILP